MPKASVIDCAARSPPACRQTIRPAVIVPNSEKVEPGPIRFLGVCLLGIWRPARRQGETRFVQLLMLDRRQSGYNAVEKVPAVCVQSHIREACLLARALTQNNSPMKYVAVKFLKDTLSALGLYVIVLWIAAVPSGVAKAQKPPKVQDAKNRSTGKAEPPDARVRSGL